MGGGVAEDAERGETFRQGGEAGLQGGSGADLLTQVSDIEDAD